ncbi:MAG: acetyl-CoA hydrolase/transferase family protein [Porphyromonas sp.]|nr:acetyl-CoA hydrolase/transferase family protein [Porphyromonas sp.]
MSLDFMTADEAARFVHNDDTVGFSGFTPAGCPKVLPHAIAKYAEEEHQAGRPFQITMVTGASTGDRTDGELARAKAVKRRFPYQSNKSLRQLINSGETEYIDMHLSILAQELRYGFYGKVDVAIVEAAEVTPEGEIVPTTAVGILPTICEMADRIIVELNDKHPKEIRGLHDICELADPPHRQSIDISKPEDRIGRDHVKVDPKKIVAVVRTSEPNDDSAFTPVDEVTAAIGTNVANFLANEIREGRIPESFLPLQSGVGNVANAVLGAMGDNEEIPPFKIYTEVIQDAVIRLMKQGKVTFASGCSLSVSRDCILDIYKDLPYFKERLVLRPQEFSNNPGIVRRLGVISINTAIEADIYGNINSTHITGTKMMNGIGGSGDFTRSAYISIFTTPSVAKDGNISCFVPMVSHTDHTEHSVNVIVSEQGVADLRGKSPRERAECIIENVVHPDYRENLRQYLDICGPGQTRHNLAACFEYHRQFMDKGTMKDVDWSKFR